jgi:hypothetical protein
MKRQDLLNRFTFHPVSSADTASIYETIRREALGLAELLDRFCPDSRELSLAVTTLEEVVFWANAAVARHNSDGTRVLVNDPKGTVADPNQPTLDETE